MAQITFLGTGGDSYTVSKQVRGSGGIIIDLDGHQFHLDPGPGSLAAAKQCGIDLRKNVAVLVSHAHLNHAGDANAVLSAMSFGGIDPHGVLLASESAMNGVEGISPAISSFHARCAERAIPLSGVPRVGINTIDVRIVPAAHSDPSAVGFQLVGEKERISYTGDTGLAKDVVDGHRGASVLVLNMPLASDEHKSTLLNPDDAIAFIEEVKPKLAILTHFGAQLLREDVRAVARRIHTATKVHVLVADDGLVVDLGTYR